MNTQLKTKRLTVRGSQPSVFDAMLVLVSDFDVVRNTANGPHPVGHASLRNFQLLRPQD
ncbi:hypothetical protein [Aliiroseovarius sp. F20344]|uniref:hypothetical protein n=1 Tax=Aliiroseovarius sp. F20344 TaxID=2926414 RepID=UPI001FF6B7A4|nr:hypothetical protein [Aliiroseovarius sp. F20344]MCK0143703.1 hypothetical protein [Aliiroseovarius sp. F20344]